MQQAQKEHILSLWRTSRKADKEYLLALREQQLVEDDPVALKMRGAADALAAACGDNIQVNSYGVVLTRTPQGSWEPA